MKKMFKVFTVAALTVTMMSCYSLSYSVGNGAQYGERSRGKNHYLIEGLIHLGGKTPADLAAGASDYDVRIVHTFLDGLIAGITGGLYTPTTVVVTQ
ncbi:MAG: Bor family protein [Paludibacter sp.]|nr:Bor family protein [Paludibacter sp.]